MMYGVSVEAASAARGGRRDVSVKDLLRVQSWKLLEGSGTQWADGLLTVKHLHGIMVVQVASKAGGCLGIGSKLSVVIFSVFSNK